MGLVIVLNGPSLDFSANPGSLTVAFVLGALAGAVSVLVYRLGPRLLALSDTKSTVRQ